MLVNILPTCTAFRLLLNPISAGPGGQFTQDDYTAMLVNILRRERQRQREGHLPSWNGGCLLLCLCCCASA